MSIVPVSHPSFSFSSSHWSPLMGRKKKPAKDLTTEEAVKRLFPLDSPA